MNRTLFELGAEYERSAAVVKGRIDRKRAELKKLDNMICSNEAYELKRELRQLYAEYREAREIAEYLKTYYEPCEGKREIFSYK